MSTAFKKCFTKGQRTLFSVITLTFILAFTTGCFSLSRSDSRENRTLMDLINFFNDSGLKVEVVQPTVYQTLLASRGCALTIDGAKVEVYIYDITNKIQKKKLDKIKKRKKIKVLVLDIPVVINGGMVMMTYSSHPNKAKIIRTFKRFPKNYKKK